MLEQQTKRMRAWFGGCVQQSIYNVVEPAVMTRQGILHFSPNLAVAVCNNSDLGIPIVLLFAPKGEKGAQKTCHHHGQDRSNVP